MVEAAASNAGSLGHSRKRSTLAAGRFDMVSRQCFITFADARTSCVPGGWLLGPTTIKTCDGSAPKAKEERRRTFRIIACGRAMPPIKAAMQRYASPSRAEAQTIDFGGICLEAPKAGQASNLRDSAGRAIAGNLECA